MDFDRVAGYKSAALFKNERQITAERRNVLQSMDKDFLSQIDKVDELIPQITPKLDDETLICECFCVNVRDIRELCSSSVDLDLLEARLNLGTGCQSCLRDRDTWINKIF